MLSYIIVWLILEVWRYLSIHSSLQVLVPYTYGNRTRSSLRMPTSKPPDGTRASADTVLTIMLDRSSSKLLSISDSVFCGFFLFVCLLFFCVCDQVTSFKIADEIFRGTSSVDISRPRTHGGDLADDIEYYRMGPCRWRITIGIDNGLAPK